MVKIVRGSSREPRRARLFLWSFRRRYLRKEWADFNLKYSSRFARSSPTRIEHSGNNLRQFLNFSDDVYIRSYVLNRWDDYKRKYLSRQRSGLYIFGSGPGFEPCLERAVVVRLLRQALTVRRFETSIPRAIKSMHRVKKREVLN